MKNKSNNPVVSVKILDRDALIAHLMVENATLRASSMKSEYLVAQERRFNLVPVSVAFMEKHVLNLIASNIKLVTNAVQVHDLVRQKKCFDYWEEAKLFGLKAAIDEALKANEKYFSDGKRK